MEQVIQSLWTMWENLKPVLIIMSVLLSVTIVILIIKQKSALLSFFLLCIFGGIILGIGWALN